MSSISGKSCAAAVLITLSLAPGGSWAEMAFSGLSEGQEANVLALSPLSTTGCDAAQWRVERLFDDADGHIVTALRALGYYEPQISKSLTWENDCWRAAFTIDPGEPVRLDR